MNKVRPLTEQEGYERGKQDKLGQYAADPYRWVQPWAEKFGIFERGYYRGHNETERREP